MNNDALTEVQRKNSEQESLLKERKKALKELKKAQKRNARLMRRNAKTQAKKDLRDRGYTGPVILLNPSTGRAMGTVRCMNAKGMTYVDVGTLRAGSSPFAGPDKIPIKIMTGRDGTKYAIPINPKTGRVPDEALFARFLNESEGGRKGRGRSVVIDIDKEAAKTFDKPKVGYTPEELMKIGWWQHPAESDIRGIDDPSSSVYSVLRGASSKSGTEAGKKIAIISPEDDHIRKVLIDNFTGTELRNAVKDSGILITTGASGKGASGFYRYKQPGVDCPQIVLESGADEDTITHEFTHHLRFTDETRDDVSRTPYPVGDDGCIDAVAWGMMSKDELATLKNMEESATVAEAASRTRKPTEKPTGYYQRIEGHNPENTGLTEALEMYKHDRETLLESNKGYVPVKGKRATKRVNDRFLETNISKLKMGGTPASTSVKNKRESGTMPKAKSKTGSEKTSVSSAKTSKSTGSAKKGSKTATQTTLGKKKVRI